MAIKKKQTLRSKAASRASKPTEGKASLSKYQKPALQQEANPYLHQLRITKKEKQSEKSNDFLQKLNSSNLSNGLSKSALRRQKRKAKSQLKSNIGDLADVLPEEDASMTAGSSTTSNPFASSSSGFVPATKKHLNHQPNPHKSLKGARKVEELEKARFGLIMTDKSYQASPFEALKSTVQQNLEKFV